MDKKDVYMVSPAIIRGEKGKTGHYSGIHYYSHFIDDFMKKTNVIRDTYDLTNIKINSVYDSNKWIDNSDCVIIIIPAENIRDFMILIGYAISHNKKLLILFPSEITDEVVAEIIDKNFSNIYVDRIFEQADNFSELRRKLSLLMHEDNRV